MSYWQTIPHTMFDFENFYSEIAEQLPNDCNIAEVGVADGASSLYLAEKLSELGKSYYLRMIDSLDYGHLDQLKTIIDNVIKSGQAENIDILPFDSLNASLKFPDNYFDFLYIDSGHSYELTKAEIRLWIRKVKDGGILAGHDYLSEENPGVRQAVDEVVHYSSLKVYDTDKGYGVWAIHKNVDTLIL
jgi:predicted O-methyltransferase YrrM